MTRSKAIPDRWLDYNRLGGIVPGTRFIPFKVPLKESISCKLPAEARFTPIDLLQRVCGLGLVIDLTCTDRYYDRDFILRNGVYHAKIVCAGQQIPHPGVVSQFFDTVDGFLTDRRNDGKLIGVHCTHGVNRTGYLVCRYMIDRLRMSPDEAIREFESARGHRFDRAEYVSDLQEPRGVVPWTNRHSPVPPRDPFTYVEAGYRAPLPPRVSFPYVGAAYDAPLPPNYAPSNGYRR